MDLGTKLRTLRANHNLSQKEVAAKIGMTKQAYYKYETGYIRKPQYNVLNKLADLYGVSVDTLTDDNIRNLALSDNGSISVVGSNNNFFANLDDIEKAILEKVHKMSIEQKAKLLVELGEENADH